MELLSQYGLFLAKVVTIVLAIGALVVLTFGVTQRKRPRKGELQVMNLGEQYREMQNEMRDTCMSDAERKLVAKRKEDKAAAKEEKLRAKRGDEKVVKTAPLRIGFQRQHGRRRSQCVA